MSLRTPPYDTIGCSRCDDDLHCSYDHPLCSSCESEARYVDNDGKLKCADCAGYGCFCDGIGCGKKLTDERTKVRAGKWDFCRRCFHAGEGAVAMVTGIAMMFGGLAR